MINFSWKGFWETMRAYTADEEPARWEPNSGTSGDAGVPVISDIPAMIAALNGDLANEYKHMHFYLNAAVRVEGLHRPEIREFLLEQAKQEMGHVQAFADLIVGMGGEPVSLPAEFNSSLTDPRSILEYALDMEVEVLGNYLTRMAQADTMAEGVWGRRITIFLEDQMDDTGRDVDEIRQLLKGQRG